MISILIIINYIVSNFPIAVNHFILDTNGFYLIRQMQHNTLWCVCWFFSPLSLSPVQLSGTPPGPSCYWQYSAVSQALFWVSVPSPTDPRTGESAPVASPWFCQVTVKTQGNPEDQRERERECQFRNLVFRCVFVQHFTSVLTFDLRISCTSGVGNLYRRDSDVLWQTLHVLAFLLVLHHWLGGHHPGLYCRSVQSVVCVDVSTCDK